ncbi:MAG: hypothetical protein E7284_09580 [Lachnospiraceae bacterium]|nr:hypothetical protein [Lachnospiraceae bacterium]
MDNFMDKLAQKYNAQEMIKANAQAEASEMQRLQEQVAAYEGILQDMRKLNYKNSELTDRIYALVDESISKVQGIHKNDEEAGDVAASLSDEIMKALEEALSNLDTTVGTALNESVSGALMVPVDQMKQSTQEVSGSVAAVRQIAEDVKTTADEIRYASDMVRTSADDVTNSALEVRNSVEGMQTVAAEVKTSADEVKESMEQVKDTVRGVMISTEDMKISTEEIKATTEDLKHSTEDLKSSVKTSVDNALLTIRRENREIADHLEYIRSTVDTIQKPSAEEEMRKAEEEQRKLQEEQLKEEARIAREAENKKALEEMFRQSDDFVHKENVKVYRNVQAVVVDELKNQTEGLTKHNQELYSKMKSTKTLMFIAIAIGLANIVLTVLMIMGIV